MAKVTGKLMTITLDNCALGYSQSFTVNMTESVVDVTNRDSSWWGEYLRGRREWTIDFSGLYSSTDLGKKVLQYFYDTHTDVAVAVVLTLADGTNTLSGDAILTGLVYDGPFEGAATMSGTLQGTAALTQLTS